MTSSATPRLDFLLRRLILLAGEVHDRLASGDWEGAMPAQEEFDEEFAMLQRLVETGHTFEQRHTQDLVRLRHVHSENEALASDLRRSAGIEVGTVSNVRRMSSAYAPLGSNHRPIPRYIDGSA